MRLEGRNLELNMRGEDVKLLQGQLRRLGFTITDVKGVFGSNTFRSDQHFPRERGIGPMTKMVDELDIGTGVALVQVIQENGCPVAGVTVWEFAKAGSS